MIKIVLTMLLFITGCAQMSVVRTAIDLKGAETADRLRDDSEFIMCRGITIGSWVRRYGRDPALASAWQVLCGSETISSLPITR